MSEIITRGELPKKPIPGLVIRYSYLWHREAQEKRIEGLKSRPCAVVLSHSSVRLFPGRIVADVVPITQTPTDGAVELPLSVKRRMGLDDAPSWIVTTEINRFFWPGADLRRVKEAWQPGGPVWHWGVLPVDIFNKAREAVLKHRADKTLAIVPRSY